MTGMLANATDSDAEGDYLSAKSKSAHDRKNRTACRIDFVGVSLGVFCGNIGN
jgi:DNA topoisomerase IA